MTTNNDFVKQWANMNQPFAETMGELIKTSMVSYKEMQKMNAEAFHTLLENQQEAMKANSSLSTLQNFNEIIQSAMRQFADQGTSIVSAYTDSLTLYIEKIKNAHNAEDMMMAQMEMIHYFQSKVKETTQESINTLSSLRVGTTALAENAVKDMVDKKQ